MTPVFAFLALASLAQTGATPSPTTAISEASTSEAAEAAGQWLSLLDQGRWQESYQATGKAFRKLNTAQAWKAASQRVRVPLGALMTRQIVSEENLPAPPYGYQVVKFRTRYANKADALETVALNREDGAWHVVGVTVE